MIRSSSIALLVGLGLFVLPAGAQDMPTEKPAEAAAQAKGDKSAKSPRLFGIWTRFTSLTEDQKREIAAIHRKVLAEKRKLDQQEEADITALLTEEQKQELVTLKEEQSAKRKEVAAKTKDEAAPAEKKTDDAPKADDAPAEGMK